MLPSRMHCKELQEKDGGRNKPKFYLILRKVKVKCKKKKKIIINKWVLFPKFHTIIATC